MDPQSVVTVASAKSGQSESLPVSLSTTTVKELSEWCIALFGLEGEVRLFKDGKALDSGMNLEQAGVRNGDLLAAQEARTTAAASAPPARAAGGGLDFSNLLGGAGAAAAPLGGGGGGGLDFSNLLGESALAPKNNGPVYYPGMSLNEAWENNPAPENMITLLQTNEHLFKELNYHFPTLAKLIQGQPYDTAVRIFREEIIKGGIETALSRTNKYHKENEMKRRLKENPNDEEVRLASLLLL